MKISPLLTPKAFVAIFTLACLQLLSVNAKAEAIVDNQDSSFATTGNWSASTSSSGYYGGNYQYAFAGTGANTATWTIGIGAAGLYDISAQWTTWSNRAPDAAYTIYNNGVNLGTVYVDQRSDGGQFNLLGNYSLAAGTVNVVLTDNASGVVIADAVEVTYVDPVGNLPPNGLIDTPANDITILIGDSVDFSATGNDPDGILAPTFLWQFGAGSGIADSALEDPGLIQFNILGTFIVTLSVVDELLLPDPSPATITVTVVNSLTSDVVVDNQDSNFATTGNWSASTSSSGYYGGNYQYAFAGTGANTATWTIGIGAAGLYDISAQWTTWSNRAPDAAYTIYNNGVNLGTVYVDQRSDGGQFNLLGNYSLAAGTVNVVLTDNASGVVIADAVEVTYVDPFGNLPPNGLIDTPANDITILIGDSVDFSATGNDPDGILAPTFLWQFGAGSGIADSALEDPGLIQFNILGTFIVTLSVVDELLLPDPSPATITVTVVNSLTSDVVVDNQDSNFATTGNWSASTSSSGYYGGNYQYAFAGTGANTATWTIGIGAAGLYDISAQWTTWSNRAPDAAYTIYNNGVNLGTVYVDQRSDGGQFNLLGNYSLAAGTVNVVLTDNASGVVIADAVEVTYVGPVDNLPPNGFIDTPENDITILVGYSVDFSATGNDPFGILAPTFLWQFGAGSGIADSTLEDPGLIPFNNLGIFTVTLQVTDELFLSDPSPATIRVTVTSLESDIIVDNQDSSFATTGSWSASASNSGYYGGNYQYAFAGTGANTATWTIGIDADGLYDIAAQWTSWTNRAPDAAYTIYNNGVNLGTTYVDQRSDGGQFNLLGNYELAAGTVNVVLTDNASGVVVADAVKVCGFSACLTQALTQTQVITSPSKSSIIENTDIYVRVAATSYQTGWGIEFILEGAQENSVVDYSPPFENIFIGVTKAEHFIETYFVDSQGTRQTGFYDRVDFGVGDVYVAFGDSITLGVADDIYTDNVSQDQRNAGGGFEPILNNLLTQSKGFPHSIINAGISGNTALDGVNRIVDTINANPSASQYLIMFGTNDAVTYGLDSGMGFTSANIEYAGTYKDHMQQIITAITDAGKTPILAKVPARLPLTHLDNELIEEYNIAINELVLANGITTLPPDFYALFENNASFYSDAIHPNGIGYNAMAELWSYILVSQ